jgi:hypothetical protein
MRLAGYEVIELFGVELFEEGLEQGWFLLLPLSFCLAGLRRVRL